MMHRLDGRWYQVESLIHRHANVSDRVMRWWNNNKFVEYSIINLLQVLCNYIYKNDYLQIHKVQCCQSFPPKLLKSKSSNDEAWEEPKAQMA